MAVALAASSRAIFSFFWERCQAAVPVSTESPRKGTIGMPGRIASDSVRKEARPSADG